MNVLIRIAAATLVLAARGPVARADVVTDWNSTAITVTTGGSAYPQFRTLAAMHAAIHDAVNAVERRYKPCAVDLEAPAGSSVDAAVAMAAHDVLVGLVPAQKAAIDAALATSLTQAGGGKATDDGAAVGKQIAARVLAMCASDGFTAKVEVKPAALPPPCGSSRRDGRRQS